MVESYNSRFKSYEGNITGTQLKTLKLTVESNNESADTNNTITMFLNNEEIKENTSIDTNANLFFLWKTKFVYGTNGLVSRIIVTKI